MRYTDVIGDVPKQAAGDRLGFCRVARMFSCLQGWRRRFAVARLDKAAVSNALLKLKCLFETLRIVQFGCSLPNSNKPLIAVNGRDLGPDQVFVEHSAAPQNREEV